MFGEGNYLKIWKVENKGNYTICECSTNKKNTATNTYETDFSSKYVRFVGNAHKKSPQPNDRIKLKSCGVQNVYVKNGEKVYMQNPTFIVFDFERENSSATNNTNYIPAEYLAGGNAPTFEEIGGGDGLPF